MGSEKTTPGAQTMRRALQILKTLAVHHEAGMGVTDVVQATELERSTAHRLLTCLVEEGFADKSEGRRYRLGLEAMKLGFATMSRAPLVSTYQNLLRNVAAATGDTVFLMLRQGDYAVCLAREEGPHSVPIFSTRVGDIRPLGIGVGGMALLAAADTATIARVRGQHGRALESAGLVDGIIGPVIGRARRIGYAEMLDTVTQGVAGVACVIPSDGVPFAAVTIAASSARMTPERRAELGRFLMDSVRDFHSRSA